MDMKKQDLCLVGNRNVITEDSPEPPMPPPPPVTILGGRSLVGPANSVQRIPAISMREIQGGTTLYWGELRRRRRRSAIIPMTTLGGQGAPPIHPMLPHPAPDGIEQVGPPPAPVALGESLPPPAVASSAGHSPVVPATATTTTTAVQGIPATSVQGIPGGTTLSGGGVAPNDPSSSVNTNPDRAQPVIADPADGDTAAGRMLRIMRELMRTAILDPALSTLCHLLFKAIIDGDMERTYYIMFMAAMLLLMRKHFF